MKYESNFAGELVRGHTTKIVAMKFSPREMLEGMEDNEYEIYTYMKAIDNSTVENYGIPAVYYYGQWEGCTLIAITLLDSRFNQIFNNPLLERNDIDIFIICREYVSIISDKLNYLIVIITLHRLEYRNICIDTAFATKTQNWTI